MKTIKRLIILNLITFTLFGILPNVKYPVEKIEKLASNENKIEVIKEIVTAKEEEKTTIKENLTFAFDKNLLEKSNIQETTLAKAFEGTAMKGLEKYFIQAEKETGVNALYLAGLACHESGWNTSEFAKTRNNLFGWQSYDSNLNATKRFESKEQCILFVASKIKKLYLTENGTFHSGYTIASISKRYASDKKHAQKVYKNIQKMLDKIEQA